MHHENTSKSLINGIELHVPSEFDRILPVSPSSIPFTFEGPAWRGLNSVVKQGDVVFDVGASYGVLTALLACLVGHTGRVHSFEANPLLQPFIRSLLAANNLGERVIHHCVCVADQTGDLVEFYVVPDYLSPASTRNPHIVNFHSDAKLIKVQTLSLDDVGLRPDVIKIDVEGSEYLALKGAWHILQDCRPKIVLETHANEIDGIGGSLVEVCSLLTSLQYQLTDLETGNAMDGVCFAKEYSEKIGYLLATHA